MKIEYEREVSHCEKSEYVQEVTVSEVANAQNSDNLDTIKVEEMFWEFIAKRDMYKVGDKIFVIPADSILPIELSDKLGVTKFLSKGRVKAIKLRGNRSEGLIATKEIVEPYLPYILKYEDAPTTTMIQSFGKVGKYYNCIENFYKEAVPKEFQIFGKVVNVLNNSRSLEKGKGYWYSEKIHGTNFRCGYLKNPETGKYCDYVGTHRTVQSNPYKKLSLYQRLKLCYYLFRQDLKDISKKKSIYSKLLAAWKKVNRKIEPSVYWKVYNEYKDIIRQYPDKVFYGEIYGPGIQKLTYDVPQGEHRVLFFTIADKEGIFSNPINHMEYHGLPFIESYPFYYDNIETLRNLANSKSEYTSLHCREGIVIFDKNNNKFVKCIGSDYMNLEKRTERH